MGTRGYGDMGTWGHRDMGTRVRGYAGTRDARTSELGHPRRGLEDVTNKQHLIFQLNFNCKIQVWAVICSALPILPWELWLQNRIVST